MTPVNDYYTVARAKANNILSLAEQVKQTLKDAQEAQEKAKISINQANQAIDNIDQNMRNV